MVQVPSICQPTRNEVITLRNYFEDANLYGFAGMLELFYLPESAADSQIRSIVLTDVYVEYENGYIREPRWYLPLINIPRYESVYRRCWFFWKYQQAIDRVIPHGTYMADLIFREAVYCCCPGNSKHFEKPKFFQSFSVTEGYQL